MLMKVQPIVPAVMHSSQQAMRMAGPLLPCIHLTEAPLPLSSPLLDILCGCRLPPWIQWINSAFTVFYIRIGLEGRVLGPASWAK